MMSVSDEVSASRSQDSLTAVKYLTAGNTLVEPMEIDGKRPVSLQMFTEVPPHGLQGTILTLKEAEPSETMFESYLASKSTRVKSGSDVDLQAGQSSSSQLQQCFVSSNVVPQKLVLTVPSSCTVDPQCSQASVSAVKFSRSNQFTANLPLSARKVRPASDLAAKSRISASGVVTLIGKSGVVLPNDMQQNVHVGGSLLKVPPVRAGLQPKSRQSISNLLKGSDHQPSRAGGKVTQMPNIFSRSKTAKKLPNVSEPLPVIMSSQSSPAVLASPVIQVATTMASTVGKPKVTSSIVRSQLVASSSESLIVVNPPATVLSSTVVPSLSSFGFDIVGGSRIIRLASPLNVSVTPVGTFTLSGTSPKPAAGAVRIPGSSASGTPPSVHKPLLTSSIAMNMIPRTGNKTHKPMSTLTSFRMHNAGKTLKSPSGFSSVQNPISPVLKGLERPSLKRRACGMQEEQLKKRRKLLSGIVYSIELPDGQKLTGTWDNGMIRNVTSATPSARKMVENSAFEKAASPFVAQLNNERSGSNDGRESCKSSSCSDVKSKVAETAETGNSRFYICLTCKTLFSQNVPCGNCSAMPQPCIFRSVPDKTNKPPAAAASASAAATAAAVDATDSHSVSSPSVVLSAMSQQVAINAGQPKLNRIILMQGSASTSRQIHVTQRPLDQATASPSVRLNLPAQLHPSMAALGTGTARTPTSRLMRRKMIVQKRPEPDVVQILSSDDEDNHALASGNSSQTGALPSVSSAAQPPVATQESQESHTEPMNTRDAPALIENHLFTIKIRLVRFGTLQRSSVVECSFYVDGIKIVFCKDEIIDSNSLYIPVADLQVIRVHYGPCGPVFFLHATPGVGVRLREIFRMSLQGCIFDPEHKDDACRFITIIPDKNQVVAEAIVAAMIEKMQDGCTGGHKFTVQTINGELASQLLKAKVSVPATEVTTTNVNATQKVIFITANGQIIQRHIVSAELASQALMVRPTEGEEEEELADRSRSPSPPHPIFIGPIVKLFTYPAPPATGGIAVTNEDFFCLKDGEYLNDVIIDFYLKYLLREVLSKENRDRTHVFSSFFYRRLMQKQAGKHSVETNMAVPQLRHSRVRTWTRHVDLFSKDFIIVPINESAHWFLAIICFPGLGGIVSEESKQQNTNSTAEGVMDTGSNTENNKVTDDTQTASQDSSRIETDLQKKEQKKPCILIFDSLALPTRYGVVRTLREYLQTEWDVKRKAKEGPRSFTKDNMQGACPRCPRQTNYSDCGVYVLQYVESFFKDPITDFTLPITTLANWFSEDVIVSKRESLRQLVLRLQKGLNPDLEYDPRQNSVDSLTSGSNLQLMNSSANASVAEKMPSDSGLNATPVTSSISEDHEHRASDRQRNGDLGDESSTSADPPTSTDANFTHPASNSHSVVTSSSLLQENSKALSQTAIPDSKENVCRDYLSNPQGNAASADSEKTSLSNAEQLNADHTNINSAVTETCLDSATVGYQEFSLLQISNQNSIQVKECGDSVSTSCQQPLPRNTSETQSKDTRSAPNSWLSEYPCNVVEDLNEPSDTVTGVSRTFTEEQMSTSATGLEFDHGNGHYLYQNVSCSETLAPDSRSLTGVSSSTLENSVIPLTDEHLETGLCHSQKQSSQETCEFAASSCIDTLNAECNTSDQTL